MSIMIYGVYNSVDAAELAAQRIKRTLPGVRVSGVSRRYSTGEDNPYYFVAYNNFPVASSGSYGSFGFNYTGFPFGFYGGSGAEGRSDIEPDLRTEASLRVEAPDGQLAKKAVSLMRSTGGREIHEVKETKRV